MKSQLTFTAAQLVFGIAALGFATVGFQPSSNSGETAPQVQVAEGGDARPHHIRCYNGLKSGQGSLYRGWVCEEDTPTLRN